MLKKRLIGVITVRSGLAVQSFSYKNYLPLGRPEIIAENLDRWGADEIFIQVIDRNVLGLGPDFQLLEKIAAMGISTPLVYGGGILCEEDAVKVVRAGADRVCVDSLLHRESNEIEKIAYRLGSQAVIANLPLMGSEKDKINWYNYRDKTSGEISQKVWDILEGDFISELLITDVEHEGSAGEFNFDLIDAFLGKNIPLIPFGGLTNNEDILKALLNERVSAVAIGNSLSYKEHAVQSYKAKLGIAPVRPPLYERMS